MFHKNHRLNFPIRLVVVIPAVLVILSLACSLPSFSRETPTPEIVDAVLEPTAEPTFQPVAPAPTLPPALVESNPRPGSEIALSQPITLYFNQPMDHPSVEGALTGQPTLSGKFTWENDSILTFIPDSPFLPDTELLLTIGETAKSQKGLALLNPIELRYRTAGYLRLSQVLPEPGAQDVDPSSAVVAVFNRPVVPLGADPASFPSLLSIETGAGEEPQGTGEWINTSTYVFYPEPGLAGGQSISVQVDPSVAGVDGAPLDPETSEAAAPLEWSFTTAFPELILTDPRAGQGQVPLDQEVRLTFNQVMDKESVEDAFKLVDPLGQVVQGTIEWSDDGREFTFTPDELLSRSSTYEISISDTARALGGTPLGPSMRQVFITVAPLAVTMTNPVEGGIVNQYNPVEIYLSAPLPDEDLLEYIAVTPDVPDLNYYFDNAELVLRIFGSFQPETSYNLVIFGNLEDRWGSTLGENYLLNFSTASLSPTLAVTVPSDVLFLTPQDTSLKIQAASIGQVTLSVGSVPFEDFVVMMGPDGYNIRQTYQPANMQTWVQTLNAPTNQLNTLDLFVSPDGSPLSPGLYYMRINTGLQNVSTGPYLLVVSNVQATIKLSQADALIWAVDLNSSEPVEGLPAAIYDEAGVLMAEGTTDTVGIFQAEIEASWEPYLSWYGLLGSPGQDNFGLVASTWTYGINPWAFGLREGFTPPGRLMYVYTDRPIYRPGQTVYFRAVVREERNGRYSMPDTGSVPMVLYDGNGMEISRFDLSLSAFGTGHGEYQIPLDADPGYYRLGDDYPNNVIFQVAEYRKPEINLQVSFMEEQALAGERIAAEVNARYFFDAPASNVKVVWSLYQAPEGFEIPGYTVGLSAIDLFESWVGRFGVGLGSLIETGEDQTGPDGLLSLEFPIEEEDENHQRYRYTLEATLTDESGFPVSARGSIVVNPAPYYIGIRPHSWMGTVGQPLNFDTAAVTWDLLSAGGRSLQAEFQKVEWVRDDSLSYQAFMWPRYVPEYTFVGSTDFVTGSDGKAALSFTPEEPGTYELRVSGDGTSSSVILWVGGAGTVVWPDAPNGKLTLTADQEMYQSGETASIYVPNPFGDDTLALVTVERGLIMRSEVVQVTGSGLNYEITLGNEDAPNVYLAVTLLGRGESGKLDFRQGFVELVVEPSEQELNVELTRQPQRAGPGDELTLHLRVTDSAGEPVQGEFSIAVVDLAALALADPNSLEILEAFYGKQPLSVRTALDLAVHPDRFTNNPGGMGGGGEAPPQVAREDFPDTAYWNAQLVTNENGEGTVSVTLPDSLTTWKIDVRGLTAKTQVGQAESEVITTKDLLVRPVVPRFLVSGDRVLLAAVVQNNTASNLDVTVSLDAAGVILEESAGVDQQVSVPASGRTRVEWWVTVQNVDNASLVFSAVSGNLQDAARPTSGDIPVLHYTSPQAFASSGVLEDNGDEGSLERLELVSLPRSYDPGSGELRVELSPSLGAAVIDALEALKNAPYETTEQTLSTFLANLETYQALNQIGISAPELQADLDRSLRDGLSRLSMRQNEDGGWGWWSRSDSDTYMTSYILYGLARAKQAGIQIDAGMIERAATYLSMSLVPPGELGDAIALDRLSLAYFALSEAGYLDPSLPPQLYEVRAQLNPWAQAFLALTLQEISPGDETISTLLSDLQAGAILTSTGVHWQEREGSRGNYSSPLTTSSIVVYALAQLEPASELLPGAVRYIALHRDTQGGWASTYETAWSILAVVEVMKGTGEWGSSYTFGAEVNGTPLASGTASGAAEAATVSASVPADRLYPDVPNALLISREPGPGRLYYTAYLDVEQPVELVSGLNRGITISRSYHARGQDCPGRNCPSLTGASVGETLQVKVSIVLPEDAYNLLVEDFIPAGSEILDTSLKTSAFVEVPEDAPLYDPADPLSTGWGWWYFQGPRIYDDHLTWAADYVPAGTYVLTYDLVILQPGEYRVLPARAWEFYFPEVQGSSAGLIFEIE